jgi:hypothetical protein
MSIAAVYAGSIATITEPMIASIRAQPKKPFAVQAPTGRNNEAQSKRSAALKAKPCLQAPAGRNNAAQGKRSAALGFPKREIKP